jgi:hypothetical protein
MSGPFTPIYLGKATVDVSGDFNLATTVMYTERFPAAQDELVPRAYVDKYVQDVIDYFGRIIDPSGDGLDASGNPTDTLGRITYLEAQVERLYKALWDVSRNVEAINTAQLGSIAADYITAGASNAELIANPPQAPVSLNGFQ